MKVVFADLAWEDYLYWQARDEKTLARINQLIKEAMRTPFSGMGKPEPVKGDLKGWWSRRINQVDRLVYRIEGAAPNQALQIAQCRYHY